MSGTHTQNGTQAAVILAAGKGTRMKSENPKVAVELLGKPLIVHVIEQLMAAGFTRLVCIVGYKREVVEEIVRGLKLPGVTVEFAVQNEQLGTGHAFLCAEEQLRDFHGPVLVASGDMPMIRAESLRALSAAHHRENNAVTVLSAALPDPTGYGRLVRDAQGRLTHIVEEKDATDEIRKIREGNTGTYLFRCPEIFGVLREIGSNNAQNEYYLPDVVALYRKRGAAVGSLMLNDPVEAQGVNSPVELGFLEQKLKERATV